MYSFSTRSLLIASALTTCTLPALADDMTAPFAYEQYQEIMRGSKLQLSNPAGKDGNKKDLFEDSKFGDYHSPYFYVDKESQDLVFKMEGFKKRSELRVLENFNTAQSDTFYRLSATITPVNPLDSVANSPKNRDEMTFLQVHNKGTKDDGVHGIGYIPHPLLRIVYDASRKGKDEHYWAVIKNNAVDCGSKSGNKGTEPCNKAYVRLDLGKMEPNTPTKFDIVVGNQTLLIERDGQKVVEHDISYWKHLLSYFKAGIYNQFKDGAAEVRFSSLEYTIDKQS